MVRLREFFNKEFENLMQQKTREMGQIKEKNQRLRYIVDEINYFSTDQIYISISDPVWTAYENIELLVNIQDSQVRQNKLKNSLQSVLVIYQFLTGSDTTLYLPKRASNTGC